jgi:hypothetical protein
MTKAEAAPEDYTIHIFPCLRRKNFMRKKIAVHLHIPSNSYNSLVEGSAGLTTTLSEFVERLINIPVFPSTTFPASVSYLSWGMRTIQT